MNYYWFNKQELLKKAKERYDNNGGKKKLLNIMLDNKDVLKEKATNIYKNLTEEEKELKRQYSRDSYNKLKENWAKLLK